VVLYSGFVLSPRMEPLWHRKPASVGIFCDIYRVEEHDKRNRLYMLGLLVSHVPLSLFNVKMTDDGTKLCMELHMVQTGGITLAQSAIWKECVTTAVERRWPLLPQQ